MDDPIAEQLECISKQIKEIEALEDTTPELLHVLIELRDCYADLEKAQLCSNLSTETLRQQSVSDAEEVVQSGDSLAYAPYSVASDASEAASDMSVSSCSEPECSSSIAPSNDLGSGYAAARSRRKLRRRARHRKHIAVTEPRFFLPDVDLSDERLKAFLTRAREVRDQSGVLELTLSRYIWGFYFYQILTENQLIAFAQRKLNGSYEWFPGIVKEIVTSVSPPPPVLSHQRLLPDVSGSSSTSGFAAPESTGRSLEGSASLSNTDTALNVVNKVTERGSFHSSQMEKQATEPTVDASCVENQHPVVLRLRVVFAAPDCLSRIPCRDFGTYCPRGHRCRYSHGVWVDVDNVRPLSTWVPSVDQLHVNTYVMFLPEEHCDIWCKGLILGITEDSVVTVRSDDSDVTSVIRLNAENKQRLLPYLPRNVMERVQLPGDSPAFLEPENDLQSTCSLSPETPEDALSVCVPHEELADVPLGYWEKHTTGFGSRMLKKMGYKMGQPLSPPSWKPGHPPRLVTPLPIRFLCPRAGLDFLPNEKTGRPGKKNKHAKTTVDFQHSGIEAFEESQKKRREREASTGAFGVLNSALKHNLKQEQQVAMEREHAALLHATRTGKKSDGLLRQEILLLERTIKTLQQEILQIRQQLSRHTGTLGVQQLRLRYASTLELKQKELAQNEERYAVVREQLQANSVQLKLNVF